MGGSGGVVPWGAVGWEVELEVIGEVGEEEEEEEEKEEEEAEKGTLPLATFFCLSRPFSS